MASSLPDEIGTLLHHIFSGKDTKSVLVSYGITSPEAESFCNTLYQRFCSTPLIRDAVRSFQEVSFITYSGNFPVTGRIDRLIQDSRNEWAVIDYKSGDKTGAELQLNVYRIAAEVLTGQPVRMFLYSMKTGEFTEPRFLSDEEIHVALKRYLGK